MKHIILASTGKKTCKNAENFALSESKKLGALLSIVHVLDYGLEHYGQVDILATEVDKTNFIEYIRKISREEAREKFTSFINTAKQNGVTAKLILEEGSLEDCLVAHSQDADVVFIGGKSRLFFKKTTRHLALSRVLDIPVRQIIN